MHHRPPSAAQTSAGRKSIPNGYGHSSSSAGNSYHPSSSHSNGYGVYSVSQNGYANGSRGTTTFCQSKCEFRRHIESVDRGHSADVDPSPAQPAPHLQQPRQSHGDCDRAVATSCCQSAKLCCKASHYFLHSSLRVQPNH